MKALILSTITVAVSSLVASAQPLVVIGDRPHRDHWHEYHHHHRPPVLVLRHRRHWHDED